MIIRCPLLKGFPVYEYEQENTTAPLMEAVEKRKCGSCKAVAEVSSESELFKLEME